ncbi:hypothetical protein BEK98_46080 [Streptomyces diastatochromogenes]|uniref:Uncharacterized protein n=1 Tax=Streptomyces diastatochromogenes TaxID=42236 RepID=A0A233RNS1_STRDA|nr:hypothetical protein BEK98_46080 [Streptomyces diastatochromogenes]
MRRIGGTAWISGISWVTSLPLPPVVIAASGMPCASTIRWCLVDTPEDLARVGALLRTHTKCAISNPS